MSTEKKNPKMFIPVIIAGVPVIIRTIIYLYVAIRGIGTLGISNYISIVLNLVMYISIIKYTIDYFIKEKDVSLKSLIFKFGIASLASLLGLQSGNKTVFMLTAIMVFIVPYVSAMINPNADLNDKNNKKNVILVSVLVFAVWVMSIILAVLYIKNPVENDLSYMGVNVYNLDAMNQAVEWTLFTFLGFTRAYVQMQRSKL